MGRCSFCCLGVAYVIQMSNPLNGGDNKDNCSKVSSTTPPSNAQNRSSPRTIAPTAVLTNGQPIPTADRNGRQISSGNGNGRVPHPSTSGVEVKTWTEKSQDLTTLSSREDSGGTSGGSSDTTSKNKSPVNKTTEEGRTRGKDSKSCCFCWCCCCSCSCLSVKNHLKGKNGTKMQPLSPLDHYLNGESDSPPTLDEIRAWGDSFDRLMKSSAGRKVFHEFLQCEYSEENILFWLACEDLKKECNPEVVEEKARVIYEDYVSILSPKEVSLDAKVREIINTNMVQPTSNTFDEAQLQIYTLMHRDSYPRFLSSPLYRRMAQLPSPTCKASISVG